MDLFGGTPKVPLRTYIDFSSDFMYLGGEWPPISPPEGRPTRLFLDQLTNDTIAIEKLQFVAFSFDAVIYNYDLEMILAPLKAIKHIYIDVGKGQWSYDYPNSQTPLASACTISTLVPRTTTFSP